jgi:hypothetical protein
MDRLSKILPKVLQQRGVPVDSLLRSAAQGWLTKEFPGEALTVVSFEKGFLIVRAGSDELLQRVQARSRDIQSALGALSYGGGIQAVQVVK